MTHVLNAVNSVNHKESCMCIYVYIYIYIHIEMNTHKLHIIVHTCLYVHYAFVESVDVPDCCG